MICPKCGGKTHVSDSRAGGDAVHRKRECKECGKVFYTEERTITGSHRYKFTYDEQMRLYHKKYYDKRKNNAKDRKNRS